jgi:hypothetical protein
MDADQDVLDVALRVLDLHVEVAVAVEDAGVDELVLGRLTSAPAVLFDELTVGKRGMRVLVEKPHI